MSKKNLISFRISDRTRDEVKHLFNAAPEGTTEPDFLRKLLEYGLYAYQTKELEIDRSFTSYQHTLESGNEALVNDIRLLISDSNEQLLEDIGMNSIGEFLLAFKEKNDLRFNIIEEKLLELKNKKTGLFK